MIDRNVAFRESCLQMTGRPLIDFMDTISIVKDYEAIRQALGSGKITYLGTCCQIMREQQKASPSQSLLERVHACFANPIA